MRYGFLPIVVTAGFALGQAQQSQQAQQSPQAQQRQQAAQAAQQAQRFKLQGNVAQNIGTTSFLGVGIQEITAERAKTLKLSEEAGVEVTRVASDSPAEKAGVKVGDVITQYNGQRVEGMDQFSRMVRETPAGRDAKLEIVRNGSPQTVTAKIAANSGPMLNGQLLLPLPNQFDLRIPDLPRSLMTWRSGALGVEAETLDGQLADFFGVKEGVLVRAVTKGSPAEKAGIKAGDVIVKIDDAKVASPADITTHLRNQRGGHTVSVLLSRERKEVTVTVTLEAVEQSRPARIVGQNLIPQNPLIVPFGIVQ